MTRIGLWLFFLLILGQASSTSASTIYQVYQNDKWLKNFDEKIEAIAFAKRWSHSSVRVEQQWIWNNYPYQIYQNENRLKEIQSYSEAISFAEKWENASVRKMPGDTWVWDNYPFEVYQDNQLKDTFSQLIEAVAFSKKTPNSVVKRKGDSFTLYENQPQYQVFQNDNLLQEFVSLSAAVTYSKKWDYSRVVRKKDQKVLWKFRDTLKGFTLHNAPLIKQNPELPRGCEVTSVAMLLNEAGVPVNKLELAEQVVKDPTPFKRLKSGKASWGDPNRGFIGSMYNLSKPGFGVYHEPLSFLINGHMKGNGLDLTGMDFKDVLYFLEKGHPIVTIINSRFRPVNDWVSWEGPNGLVRVTYREHAVLLVGYDHKYVYVNDPLSGQKNRKLNRASFEQGWIQMGRQALTHMQ